MRLCVEAVGAGLCAALASVFAKFAVTSQKVPELCQSFMQAAFFSVTNVKDSTEYPIRPAEFCITVALGLRVICFGLIFVFNAVMWTLFVKSLQRTSSIIATTTNTASNFFFTVSNTGRAQGSRSIFVIEAVSSFTAVSGWIIFGENLPSSWFFGAVLIVAGLLLINSDGRVPSDEAKQKTL